MIGNVFWKVKSKEENEQVLLLRVKVLFTTKEIVKAAETQTAIRKLKGKDKRKAPVIITSDQVVDEAEYDVEDS